MIERVNGGGSVLTVVGADRHCVKVERLVVDHFLVRRIVGLYALNAVFFEECLGFAGNEVGACHDLNIGLIEVRLDMRAGYPAASDNAHAHFAGGVHSLACLGGKGVETVH